MSALMKNPDSLNEKLATRYARRRRSCRRRRGSGAKAPARPTVSLGNDRGTGEPVLTLTPAKGDDTCGSGPCARLSNGTWTSEVLPGWLRSHRSAAATVDRVYVTAVSRTGVESLAAEAGGKAP